MLGLAWNVRTRLLRSYTFRLGVIFPLFVLWSWLASTRYATSVSVEGPRCLVAGHRGGVLRMVTWSDPAIGAWQRPSLEHTAVESRCFPGFAWRLQWDRQISDFRISHWCLMLAYLLPWGGLLFWRREKLLRAPRYPAAK